MEKIITDEQDLTLSVIPLPKDANMLGVVFGGWTLEQLDLAGSVLARRRCNNTDESVVTKAVNGVEFIAPIHIGDKVNFYSHIVKTGNTSTVVAINVVAERYTNGAFDQVATAEFVYVRVRDIV